MFFEGYPTGGGNEAVPREKEGGDTDDVEPGTRGMGAPKWQETSGVEYVYDLMEDGRLSERH